MIGQKQINFEEAWYTFFPVIYEWDEVLIFLPGDPIMFLQKKKIENYVLFV